jgi:hypothetical protein
VSLKSTILMPVAVLSGVMLLILRSVGGYQIRALTVLGGDAQSSV